MILLGVLLSTVGLDFETGEERMTFGLPFLADGIDFAVLAMGIFGIAEIMRNLDHTEHRDVVRQAIGRLLPNKDDFRQSYKPILRGTLIGAILGLLPGNGAVLGPFASYTLEKKIAKNPKRFGLGAIEGVAGQSANNAGAQTSFIPLLTLGIPPNAVMALMVGAMTIHGIIPGPQVMTKNPNLFWGMIASMWVGNLMLLDHQFALDRPLGAAVEGAVSADVPSNRHVLLHRHLLDQLVAHRRDVHRVLWVGRLCADQARLRARPTASGLRSRQADGGKSTSRADHLPGDMMTFLEHPVSAGLLVVALLLLVLALLPAISKGREEVFVEDEARVLAEFPWEQTPLRNQRERLRNRSPRRAGVGHHNKF